jgi:hypothetical protein
MPDALTEQSPDLPDVPLAAWQAAFDAIKGRWPEDTHAEIEKDARLAAAAALAAVGWERNSQPYDLGHDMQATSRLRADNDLPKEPTAVFYVEDLRQTPERAVSILRGDTRIYRLATAEDITDEMVEVGTAAVLRVHDEEIRAALSGEVPGNQWRPERYARAVLEAVFRGR